MRRKDSITMSFLELCITVGEGIVVHGLFEVDGIEDIDAVAFFKQQLSALHDDAALCWDTVKTDKSKSHMVFHLFSSELQLF